MVIRVGKSVRGKLYKVTIFSLIVLLLGSIELFAQYKQNRIENDDVLQARIIRIKRMSEPWRNQNVELRMIDSIIHSGKFLVINKGAFHLDSNGRLKTIPFANVETLILKRKKRDLLIVGLASVGVGGLIAAGASLGFNAEGSEVSIAALTGSVIGFTIGWKHFYKDFSISIK